jgi:exodeoxyribonuclease V beta subunit
MQAVLDAAGSTPHPELDALALVAGADFGDALHAILEHRVLDQPLPAQRALVREHLLAAGVRARGLDADALAGRVAQRLQGMLAAPLGGAGGPRLAALPAHRQRAEMGFDYALDGASLTRLAQACAALGEPDLVPAHDAALHGLMTGKMDLVFEHDGRVHVLDYKSNRLGDPAAQRLEDYTGAALAAAMQAHGYRFQALLYTVALERYLRQRHGDRYQRAQHLGEAWYVFVRAAGLTGVVDPRCGVWRHRFDDALLDAVQAGLAVAPRASTALPSTEATTAADADTAGGRP